MADVLIIGYGDTLRTDDSIGVEAAKVLAEFYRNDPAGSFSHRCSPVALLKAAAQLYGNAPSALSLTMSATSFEMGMALSPEISRGMPDFLTAAKHVVADFTNGRRARPIRLASQSGG